MTSQDEIKLAIQSVIMELMERVMEKVLHEDPFIKEEHRAKKPLYAALVPWTSPDLIDRFKGTMGSNRGGIYVESEVHRGVQG